MTTDTHTQTLAHDTHAVGLHGRTGRDVEEGVLPAGTLVRHVQVEYDQDGWPVSYYDASTDGGRSWYRQRTHGLVLCLKCFEEKS